MDNKEINTALAALEISRGYIEEQLESALEHFFTEEERDSLAGDLQADIDYINVAIEILKKELKECKKCADT